METTCNELGVAGPAEAEIAKGDLDGLCRVVWKRISWEMMGMQDDRPSVYPLLAERLNRTRRGVTMMGTLVPTIEGQHQLLEQFEADLRQLVAAPVEVLRRMVLNRSASPTARNSVDDIRDREQAHRAAVGGSATSQHPRTSPAELVGQFAARGVVIQAVDGMLHVSPPGALTPADRAVLTAHKAGILEALARPAAVF